MKHNVIQEILEVILKFYEDFFKFIYTHSKNLILTDNVIYRFMADHPALFGFIVLSISATIALSISLYDNIKEAKNNEGNK